LKSYHLLPLLSTLFSNFFESCEIGADRLPDCSFFCAFLPECFDNSDNKTFLVFFLSLCYYETIIRFYKNGDYLWNVMKLWRK
jgi:hypothetical protein